MRRVLIVLALLGAACSSEPGGRSSAAIELKGIAFVPPAASIDRGGVVTWTGVEAVEHTVTAGTPGTPDASRFDHVLQQGETFDFTFADAGAYDYFCRRHPANMQGIITVR